MVRAVRTSAKRSAALPEVVPMRTGPLTKGMATLPKLSAKSVVAPGLSVKVVFGAKTPGE